MQKPSLGRIVLTRVDPRQNNGSNEAPAVIVRVWNDESVNLKVLLDNDSDLWLTSVKLVEEPPSEPTVSVVPERVAYWPPRV